MTDIWNMTGTIGSSNVTIVESFYNEDSIWIGCRFEGQDLVSHSAYTLFFHDGEMVGFGSHGGTLQVDTENWIAETVRQPSFSSDIAGLPDEFTLEFVVGDMKYQEQTTTFHIPLIRSDRKVIRP